ncbi:hypothetical protein [Halobacterium salinarum]|uniref:Uncharacterized protein n=4 Tax=Halobacterium salinarum TaxID=2242 RepID=A0A510N6C1_HALSA|nr:hypothetical protein [Halobacterium salinarum]MBB6090250.1 hypothetical protein [Halobacterium salinarum]MDL0119028.1 hypothetical protein [Halobacterium salinarum]MDL0129792.1 hypothetical protein [Halobacterium salinarum]MDL0133390.1 hypothetical protein [Halobacterium salinarum]MDL0141784.1 hypothetical protein [Halobacterium salinarum]
MVTSPVVDDLRYQLVAEGWMTAHARVNPTTVMVRALRGDGQHPLRLLVLVGDDSTATVTERHVAYLVAGAGDTDADATLLTALGRITDGAHRAAEANGVAVVAPATIRNDDVDTTIHDILVATADDAGKRSVPAATTTDDSAVAVRDATDT